jgi:hypothetical protein
MRSNLPSLATRTISVAASPEARILGHSAAGNSAARNESSPPGRCPDTPLKPRRSVLRKAACRCSRQDRRHEPVKPWLQAESLLSSRKQPWQCRRARNPRDRECLRLRTYASLLRRGSCALGLRCTYRKRANAAIPRATASSSRAAGRSRPRVLDKRLLALAPPNVPATAPMIPATKPMIIPLSESPIARPHRVLVTILMMNWGGVSRLGVFGSLSLTNSPMAMRVKMYGVNV